MISLKDARDMLEHVITELKTCKMIIVNIPGENTFINCVDVKSCIKSVIKEKHLPIFVINSFLPIRESEKLKFCHVLVFIRTKELGP